ncbi:hypothetical protein B0H67DRAFT_335751 [Lasiosphaeris hirsuta]|uniref:Uncharacterized protein n=1 Tax=Lasiosphaeris hirsuta TaxID=260670 RepID=A0AA40A2Z3_9PEZI|nr:hypothetical protein B0H67DRAFT_335751 [Lasiosphaeris hirsuta]
MAVFNCIESQLYEQKKAHSQLVKLLNPPDGEKEVSLASTSVKTEIQALKAVDKTLLALVDLFEEHIGCSLPARGRSWLVRFIRNLFRSRLAAVAIDSEEVERLKKNARRELGSLQRIAPILAAHIRLREPSAVAELKRVCDAAPEGPEKREMPEKLALTPTKIGHPTTHADALKKVLRHFNDAHTRLLAEVEALNKIVGREYTLRGNALFRKATGDWGLGTPFRRLRRHVRGRNGPGLAAGGASASASASRVCLVEDAAVEKRPWRYDGIAV